MKIPVFHDDQHGTAIICLAGLTNALEIRGKKLGDVKIVCNGAGAAGIACMNLMRRAGADPEKMFVCDRNGVIYPSRGKGMNSFKLTLANSNVTKDTSLAEISKGADVLIGVSAGGAFTPEVLQNLNRDPTIFAMANPEPEVRPDVAKKLRPDCIIATGRSDFPNQINNVMFFPFLFRATLDTKSNEINEDMKLAAAKSLANLAKLPVPMEVLKATNRSEMKFGPEYLIPTPFDPRLITTLCPDIA